LNREQLLARIQRRWDAFNQACDGLPDAALMEAGVVEDWSVKDLMLHIATWEEEALKALPVIMEGKRPPRYGGVDRFNAEQSADWGARTPAEAKEAMQTSHRRLLGFLESVPESWFETETRFRHRLRLDTWSHYPEHTDAILRWRRSKGL
jgi:hypothetical protein